MACNLLRYCTCRGLGDGGGSGGHWSCSYMQKTCDVAEKAILAKKIAEKVRKSRQNVNRDKSA